MRIRIALSAAALAVLPAASAVAADPLEWTRPTAPFHIVGNIWYVGSEGLAAYLIKTPAGAILIDATMAENVPAILRNIRSIGVSPRDVRYLLVSHAHFDHAAGDAAMVKATGAKVVAGVGDVAALQSGRPPGETTYTPVNFAPVKVARGVRDGDAVSLGGVTLRAVATPGHTPGCTTWTMRTRGAGRMLDVVFPCSITVAGNRLVGNRRYPAIVRDFGKSFDRLAKLHADVVLPAHPELAEVLTRRMRGGERAYIAPGLLQTMVANARIAFADDLAKQQKR